MSECPRCGCDNDVDDWAPGKCEGCGLPFKIDSIGDMWSPEEIAIADWGDDAPAWVFRMEQAAKDGYQCSQFEAQIVAKEWRRINNERARFKQMLREICEGDIDHEYWTVTDVQKAIGDLP